ncbi:MAG: hypothetical protein KDA27_04840 [Candidatus Eisenbacteria bacterium]|uniref:Tetratricopeptide repeat protein n=1 Tax=Eiseniibacteriota bacterium TaxID=2212470 RepID=A0A956SC93_UNCEI|nr:hypothetical protein [Candidatus Eisenbacteria bacterium]
MSTEARLLPEPVREARPRNGLDSRQTERAVASKRWQFAITPAIGIAAILTAIVVVSVLPTCTDASSAAVDTKTTEVTADQGDGAAIDPATASSLDAPRWTTLEAERRLNPGGNHRLAAVDAFLLGERAWDQGQKEEARAFWTKSAAFDIAYLPPRLRLVQADLVSDFSGAMVTLRECAEVFQGDFHVQRWVLSNAILGFCLATTLSALAVVLGLLLKHSHPLHHTVTETLSYALRMNRTVAAILATVVLLLPLTANLGLVVTAMFYLFLVSYRYNRPERILALAAATWGVIVGPVLIVTSPWWSIPPDGRDAGLISEAQQDPTSPAFRLRVRQWIEDERPGVALYLEGLASKVDSEGPRAVLFYERAGRSGEVPPWVLETNVGNALIQAKEVDDGIRRYHRAIEVQPDAFEPHYNLALTQARSGRYLESDARFERASRIDLDRLRVLTRKGDRIDNPDPIDALWSPPDLWAWTLKHPGPVIAPEPLAFFLPLRSLVWATPAALLSLVCGLALGRWLKRIIRVHQCYQCGTPVCRRCLVRLDRRAYCSSCAEALGGLSSGEATRLLLKRLLDDRREWTSQIARIAAYFAPGIGTLVYGGAGIGFVAAVLGGLGVALVLYPEWGQPLFWGPWPDPISGLVRAIGVIFSILAILVGSAGVRANRRRSSTVKAFLDRDVDRLAA